MIDLFCGEGSPTEAERTALALSSGQPWEGRLQRLIREPTIALRSNCFSTALYLSGMPDATLIALERARFRDICGAHLRSAVRGPGAMLVFKEEHLFLQPDEPIHAAFFLGMHKDTEVYYHQMGDWGMCEPIERGRLSEIYGSRTFYVRPVYSYTR
jgi:hypothetical protein